MKKFRAFVEAEVVPFADAYDREESFPQRLIEKTARCGYLGALLPEEYGGGAMSMLTYGLLNEEIGRGCSSLRSLLTVHAMVAQVVLKWGSKELRKRWLPQLATGEKLAAFALTEPNIGSDAASIETSARPSGDSYLLNGQKKWITFGQMTDLFLIFAQCEGRPMACLLERDTSGLTVEPIFGMLGVRASMLAELRLEECRVPRENIVGARVSAFRMWPRWHWTLAGMQWRGAALASAKVVSKLACVMPANATSSARSSKTIS